MSGAENAYYSENDEFAALWLRNLINAGLIAPGEVDTRSIVDVRADDLRGFAQCHFFAGIGVWSHALRLAGWRDERPVWTGSCPCQPFSGARKQAGFDDQRHLWPEFFRLIGERRPGVVFGEQVASGDGLAWLDLVQTDMEAARYAFAAIDLCAASVGAPHIRQRLFWMAHASDAGREGWLPGRPDQERQALDGCLGRDGAARALADAASGQLPESQRGPQGRDGFGSDGANAPAGPTNGFWRNADWLLCRDDKWRAVEAGTFPLVNGTPARVGRLRGYGNAIVAQVAAEFIKAAIEVIP